MLARQERWSGLAAKKRPYKKRELHRDVRLVREEVLMVLPNFRSRLHEAILAAGRTQRWLSAKMGIAPQTYQSMNRQKTLTDRTLEEIERHLGVPRAYWTSDGIERARHLVALKRAASARETRRAS